MSIRVAIWPFLKLFSRNKMAIFGLFWTNLSKFQKFYEILNFNLIILANLAIFHFSGFGLFETTYGQIWPFLIFWTWEP